MQQALALARHADRPVRAQPARGLRDRRRRRPRVLGAGPHPGRRPGPRRNHGAARCRRARATGRAAPPPTSRWSPARTTAAPARAAMPWSRPASAAWSPPCPTPIRWSPARASRGCAPPASRWIVGPGAARVARTQPRLLQPHGARHALGAHEDRRLAGRQDRAGQRRQPVDHVRAGPRRRPCLARPRRRRADRHRHGAARTTPGWTCGMRRRAPARRWSWSTAACETPPDAASSLPGRRLFDLRGGPGRASARPRSKARGATVVHLPGPAARSIWPPCCATWRGARSTSCTSRPATSSMAR